MNRHRKVVSHSRARLIAVVGALPLLFTGCALHGVTTQGQAVDTLYNTIFSLAAPVFVIVEVLLLFLVFRFRKRDDREPPQTQGSNRALIIFFIIPAIIVAVLFPFGERTLSEVQAMPSPGVTIRVQGFQWEWTFNYVNEGFFSTGKTLTKPALMELPVGQPVHILLNSQDVIHSFFVPQFLFKRDVIPGRTNSFTFTPTEIGTFNGQCAEFCGLYHSKMTFIVKVVSQLDYDAWVKHEKKAALNATCPAKGQTVTMTAHNISWNTNCIAFKAGTPFKLVFQNQDTGIQHNFSIYDSSARKKNFFRTPRLTGPTTQTFNGPALKAGKYYFQCDVHGPAMAGVLIVKK
ncbi:MAG: cytochrome c oxidase subunit [Actinomycetota bacterium]|jgi:cytochrome c oxidase subunit 2|nr:cytochrome c oxidase subunit [Actinomycetota bacterium]